LRNEASWVPSKLVFDERRLRYVPHPTGVSLGSRLAVGAQAAPYEKLLRENARGRMLDCGCGKVPFYQMYREHISALTCIDWNDTGHSDLTVDLSGPLPFESGSFDTVLLSDVLEHIARPEGLINELARVLAPSGSLILTVPFLYHVHEAPHDYHRYTRFALQKLCDDSSTRDSPRSHRSARCSWARWTGPRARGPTATGVLRRANVSRSVTVCSPRSLRRSLGPTVQAACRASCVGRARRRATRSCPTA